MPLRAPVLLQPGRSTQGLSRVGQGQDFFAVCPPELLGFCGHCAITSIELAALWTGRATIHDAVRMRSGLTAHELGARR